MENMKCLMNWGQIQCFSTYRHQKWLVKQQTSPQRQAHQRQAPLRVAESQIARPKELTDL